MDHEKIESNLMSLPAEARRPVLKYLQPKMRKTIKLVCIDLANEIDQDVGPNGHFFVSLRDRRPPEALKFFGVTLFRHIAIQKRCLLKFEEAIYRPLAVENFRLIKKGKITPDFAIGVFKNLKNLKSLIWTTNCVKGMIPEDNQIYFRHLKYWKMNTKYPAQEAYERDGIVNQMYYKTHQYLKPLHENTLDQVVQNQLTLLRRLNAPKCQVAQWRLRIYENQERRVDDEDELALAVVEFIERNPQVEVDLKMRVWRDLWPLLPVESSYHRRRGANVPAPVVQILDLHRPSITTRKVSIELIRNDEMWDRLLDNILRPGTTFQIHILRFLSSLTKLEEFDFVSDVNRLQWRNVSDIIASNWQTLTLIYIKAPIIGPIDFGMISNCPSLKKIFLWNFARGYDIFGQVEIPLIAPYVVNFGPHANMIENLESLSLINIKMRMEDMASIPKLKKLTNFELQNRLRYNINGNIDWDQGRPSVEVFKQMHFTRSLNTFNVLSANLNNLSIQEQRHFRLINTLLNLDEDFWTEDRLDSEMLLSINRGVDGHSRVWKAWQAHLAQVD